MSKRLIGAAFKQKLLFFPNAGTKPKEKHEISEAALFRCLLNDEKYGKLTDQTEILNTLKALSVIDKLSKIAEFETHRSSMGSVTDLVRAFHVFIVFKTTSRPRKGGKLDEYWWSLEKNMDYIVLQRSHNKTDVKNKCYGEERNKVKTIKKRLKGKGTIRNLFAILWAHKIIPENYHIKNSNCQSLVTLVSKQITEIGYEYEGYFTFSLRENDRNTEMLNFINLLTNAFDRQHPFFPLIYYENRNLFDRVMKSGEYDINGYLDGYTPLHLAIMLSKTKMVQHLLDKWKADPIIKGKTGKNALYLAIEFAKGNTEIINLLVAHEKVDINKGDEKNGWTALHFAILSSNTTTVKHLIDKGANPNICDKNGQSPLHLAAYYEMETEIIDIILKAKNNKGIDDVDDESAFGFTGKTALHMAAMASNETTAEYLIKNGADVNYRDKLGRTPLQLTALRAKDMKIIDLIITNIKEEDVDQYNKDDKIITYAKGNLNGLGVEITDRLREKGIFGIRKYPVLSTDKSDTTSITSNEKIEYNNQSIDPVKLLFLQHFLIPLLIAAIKISNVKIVRLLIRAETDISRVTRKEGMNPLHAASKYAKTTKLIDVILETRKFDINGGDNKGRTPLYYAIEATNPTTNARHLIEKGADPAVRDKIGFTLLHAAAAFPKHIDILALLLANENVKIDERNETGCTALQFAIANSNVTTVRSLIEKGANVNIPDENGLTPLHFAAKLSNDMEIVELLLNHKDVDVNYLDNTGRNPLYYAKYNKHGLGETIANRLKKKGAVEKIKKKTFDRVEKFKNIKKFQDSCDRRVLEREMGNFLTDDKLANENKIKKMLPLILSTAIIESDVEKVRDLIEKGINISTVKWEGGINALHKASGYAKTTEFIDVILETGKFNINRGDNKGQTPLHYAITGANPVINALHLIEKGANPNIPDENGITPIHEAAKYEKDMNIDEILQSYYNDIIKNRQAGNILRNEQVTNANKIKKILPKILGEAIENSDVKKVRNLIDKEFVWGIDIGAVTWEGGINALHAASKSAKTTEIIDVILETKKFDINGIDNKGRTPLHYAIRGEYPTINGSHLIEKGANPKIPDKNGVTSLQLAAAEAKTMDLIDLFLNNAVVDVNHCDKQGRNALVHALFNEHGLRGRITARLKEKGAKLGVYKSMLYYIGWLR